MKKILFVDSADPSSEFQTRYPPLWPAYLAAYTEKYLDAGSLEFRFTTGEIETEHGADIPDLVAIGSATQNWKRTVSLAASAQKRGLPVIVGGPHITALPESLTQQMTAGVIGEGEQTFLELMQLFLEENGLTSERMKDIRGLVYRNGKGLVKTSPRPLIRPLEEIPHPKRSLIGYGEFSYIMSSRGCPFKCAFCASSTFWGGYRVASPEYVVEEIEELYHHGSRIIRILDDLFTINKKRLRELAELLKARQLHGKVGFSVCCRANLVTKELVDLLKEISVFSALIGLESGCDRTLEYLKTGGVTVEHNRKAVRLLKEGGIQTNGLFIIGSPDETEGEIRETYEFIKDSPLDFVDVFLLTPLPGTDIWDDALQRGVVSNDMDWSLLNMRVRYRDGNVPIVSKHLTRRELERWHRKFRWLRAYKILKALPGSPWLRQVPAVALGMIRQSFNRLLSSPPKGH